MKIDYNKPFVASGLIMILMGLLALLAHKHAAAPFHKLSCLCRHSDCHRILGGRLQQPDGSKIKQGHEPSCFGSTLGGRTIAKQ